MSVLPNHPHERADATDGTASSVDAFDLSAVGPAPVVVRRNAGLAALIGVGASAVAIAYLWRASQSGLFLDWTLCVLLAGIAAFYLAQLVDSRTPLLVADDLGVRIRLGDEWRGLPWDAINRVDVQPRRGPLHDGRLTVDPRSLARAVDGLDARARRHAVLNQKMYGAGLAVPVGITTRVSTRGESIADRLNALAQGRADIVEVAAEVTPGADAAVDADADANAGADAAVEPAQELQVISAVEAPPVEDRIPSDRFPSDRFPWDRAVKAAPVEKRVSDPAAAFERADQLAEMVPVQFDQGTDRPVRSRFSGVVSTFASQFTKRCADAVEPAAVHEDSAAVHEDSAAEHVAPATVHEDSDVAHADEAATGSWRVVPLRPTRAGSRAEVTRDQPASIANTALQHAPDENDRLTELPEGRELRRPGSVDLVFERPASARVRPISEFGDPVAPLVIDDFVTEPAYDPVIGPELLAARTRLGLSVDALAERTRIRPHVIESIEVDDFAPCGGDFYARGHLRTLARVLGQDVVPLIEKFDNRYATAPINARRVFEAELATGMTGSMRSTIGGPNWGLLVGVVLSLIMVWGVVRLFTGDTAALVESPAPVLNGSAGVQNPGVAPAGTRPIPVTMVAAHGLTAVVVRDGNGQVVFTGDLALGQKKQLSVRPPVQVQAVDAGAIEIQVSGKDRGVLGELGKAGRRTFKAPAAR